MPAENLTRDEARERAELLRGVRRTTSPLDLTTGSTTFASTTVVRFTATEGASTFIDLIAPTVRAVTLNGRDLDPAVVFADSRIALERPRRRERAAGRGGVRLHEHRRGAAPLRRPGRRRGLPVLPVRGRRLPARVRRLRAAGPQGGLHLHGDRARALDGGVHLPHAGAGRRARRRRGGPSAVWSFAPTPRLSSYVTAVVAGPYHRETGELTSADGRTIPLGVFCRRSLAEHLDADNDPRDHPGRVRLLRARPSTGRTRSPSTTSSSCPSSTPGRWRTRAR